MFKNFKSVSQSIEDEIVKDTRTGVYFIGIDSEQMRELKTKLDFFHRFDIVANHNRSHRLLEQCYEVETEGIKLKTEVGFISDKEEFDVAFT
jgi:hypothetical protein